MLSQDYVAAIERQAWNLISSVAECAVCTMSRIYQHFKKGDAKRFYSFLLPW